VQAWDQQQFQADSFYLEDVGLKPSRVITTPRLGISKGRDEHLLLRFIDFDLARHCSRNPLTMRSWKQDQDYRIETLQ
jgi:DNA-3-methyladenine glycosylase